MSLILFLMVIIQQTEENSDKVQRIVFPEIPHNGWFVDVGGASKTANLHCEEFLNCGCTSSLSWFFNFLQHCEEVKTADFDKIPHNVWFANIVIQLCEEVLKINIFSSLVRNFSSSKKSKILRKRRIKVKTDFLAQCKARALRSNVLIGDLLILIWDLRSVKESKIHDLSSQI